MDYYNARYYDPGVGQFLSADGVQGNAQGMDPYAYVGGDPETLVDPTGNIRGTAGGGDAGSQPCAIPGSKSCGTISGGGSGSGSGGSGTAKQPTKSSGGGNPKIVRSNRSQPQECTKACGDRDRKLIKDHINDERTHSQNVVALFADAASLVADLVAAGLDLATSTWGGLVVDAISVIARFGVVAADLSNLGVFHLDPTLVSIIGMLKGVISIIDDFKGALELFNPLKPLQDTLNLVIKSAVPRVADGIMELIAGNTSYVGVVVNGSLDLAHFNAESAAVNGYSNQQAHSICEQDYTSEPNMC